MKKYLDATRNYAAYDDEDNENGEDYGDGCDSDSSCGSDQGMEEEEETAKPGKNQPDEDGWIVASSVCWNKHASSASARALADGPPIAPWRRFSRRCSRPDCGSSPAP